MNCVVFHPPHDAPTITLEDRPDPACGPHEVLVAVRYAGVNPADALQLRGLHPPPRGAPRDIPGLEVAGSVVTRGAAVDQWELGDRVFGIVAGGGLADRVVVHAGNVTAVPDRLDELAAAAVPETFVTAHDALFVQAGLQAGEALLVNGANGGVGTAAVQIGRAAGARVYASVRTTAVRAQVTALGATVDAFKELTELVVAAGGADVVLELVGTPNLVGDLNALAPKGQIVMVGTGAGSEASFAVRTLMSKRGRILGSSLRGRSVMEKQQAVTAFTDTVVPWLADGTVAPQIDRVFPAVEIEQALGHLGQPGRFGKVLLAFDGGP